MKYGVSVSKCRTEESAAVRKIGLIFETFLSFEEAFSYVGFCMVNDIDEFGRPDVYQILFLDSFGRILVIAELDNDVIEPPCYKPTYPEFGCLGCTKCKEKEAVPGTDASGFDEFEGIISEDDLPF